jgi:hypothetical protein
MFISIDYEFRPPGSVLVHTGSGKQDDGGSWVPVVYQVGRRKFQSGATPGSKGQRTVLHRAQFETLSEAKYAADVLARLAAT